MNTGITVRNDRKDYIFKRHKLKIFLGTLSQCVGQIREIIMGTGINEK